MLLPFPRAYVDWTVPRDASGREVGIHQDERGYRAYVEWLADYLFTKDIPVPECQQELLLRFEKEGADAAVLQLSDAFGYMLWEAEIIGQTADQGVPYAEHRATEEERWATLTDEEKEMWAESDCFISEADYYRMGAEYRQSQAVPSDCQHADIPYRPILAALFKTIPEFQRRYKLLDYYFFNFDECAGK